MNKKFNVKRTITNTDDLKKYLTKDKLNEFKRQLNEFKTITHEVDKKIATLKKQTNKSDVHIDINEEYELNILISALSKI